MPSLHGIREGGPTVLRLTDQGSTTQMSATTTLLPSIKPRTWTERQLPTGWVAIERYQSVGAGAPFEVVVASAPKKPLAAELRSVWRQRHGGRATDVLLVVRYSAGPSERLTVVGPNDESWRDGVPLSSVRVCCTEALAAQAPTAVRNAVAPLFTCPVDGPTGLRNEGLFATYALRTYRTRHQMSWEAAAGRASGIRELHGTDLLRHLGWQVDTHGNTYLLRENGHSRAVAVMLQGDEVFDRGARRFGQERSPVEHALAVANKQEVPWVQAVRGRCVRLYPARADIGIRRTGLTSFVEIDLAHLPDDQLALAALLLSPEALRPGGTAFEILEDSRTRASELGSRLRDRVYDDVIPELATIVAQHAAPAGQPLTESGLNEAYHCTLVVLFRTLFVAYAEDRDLLPYTGETAAGYNRVALKNRAREWTDHTPSFDPNATDLWDDLTQIWHAIFHGSTDWGVPEYGGGLFDDGTRSGQAISDLRLTNAEIGPALKALLIDADPDDDHGPVDFSTLSVREFGTIYEGLLESSLSIAPTNLTRDKDDVYVPAKPGTRIFVHEGEVYFHGASGTRKATGSYFTKEFAVEHLLSTALDPALDEHLARVLALLNSKKPADAAALFFEFRVADIAMGSGHFLVGAVDHIATKMSLFLTDHPIEGVVFELGRLRSAAVAALEAVGREASTFTLSAEALVRRQVVRRCIYGVDINEIAVDLARLALWIHTFVPGLPMSSLEHGLVWGNSLTGIATTDELLELLEPDAAGGFGVQSLFREAIDEVLEDGRKAMQRAAILAEANSAESKEASSIRLEAEQALAPLRALFDTALAGRLGLLDLRSLAASGQDSLISAASRPVVLDALKPLHPLHFPAMFPEVFSSSDTSEKATGFDVVLGNPPWEKVRWEAVPYWTAVEPGLTALSPAKREARLTDLRALHPFEAMRETTLREEREVLQELFKATYTLRGRSHLELAQLMLERALRLLSAEGRIALVLPRQLTVLAGWTQLRTELAQNYAVEIVQARNKHEWIFEGIHESYAIAFLSARRSPGAAGVVVTVASSPDEIASYRDRLIALTHSDLASFSEALPIPWFNSADDVAVFEAIRTAPKLSGQEGWIRGLHESRWDFTGSGRDAKWAEPATNESNWVVMKTRHVDAYSIRESEPFTQSVDSSLTDLVGIGRGVLENDDGFLLGPDHPLIAFRRPSRSDDTRTLIATALPDSGYLPNSGYVHTVRVDRSYSRKFELALLALMNTATLDWWVRRFVDRHVTAPIINSLRIPDLNPQSVERLSQIASSLLVRNGTTRIAADLSLVDTTPEVGTTDLLAEAEAIALRGFSLDAHALDAISLDFSPKGLPEPLVTEAKRRLSEVPR